MTRSADQTAAALAWLYARTATLDVGVRRWRDGRPLFLHGDRHARLAALDRERLDALLGWLRHENAHGADIFVRAARSQPAAALVWLDDLRPARAVALSRRYSTLAVQTSSHSAQAWIHVAQALPEARRADVQRRLQALLHTDPGSVSGDHYGRLAGFRNRKPSHPDKPWVNVLAATAVRPLDTATLPWTMPRAAPQAQPDGHPDAASGLDGHARPQAAHEAAPTSPTAAGTDTAAGLPCGNSRSHTPPQGGREDRWTTGDPSRDDWANVRRRLALGQSPDAVIAWLAEDARARGKRNPDDYARRTVAAARAYSTPRPRRSTS